MTGHDRQNLHGLEMTRHRILVGVMLAALSTLTACSFLPESENAGDEQVEATTGDQDSDEPDTDELQAVVEPATTTSTQPEPAAMPDVISQTETEARATLAQLGISDVSVSQKESFGPPGVALEQPSPRWRWPASS